MTRALAVVTALTVLRLVLAAAYPLADAAARLPIVVAGAASDLADGRIARRWGAESWLGGLLDAVADKLFTLAILGVAWRDGVLAAPLLAAVLARDAAVVGAAAVVAAMRRWDGFRRMPSRPLGKATTAAVFALGIAVVVAPERAAVVATAATVAAAFSIAAAADYLRQLAHARP